MTESKRFPGLSFLPPAVLLFALAKFAVHLYSAPGYGFFGDEFYTIALSRHLAFGYVDLPPVVPALVALSRALLGNSFFAYRIFPALAGAATLVVVCAMAREFGGKTFAVALAALGYLAVPIWLSVNSIFCYDGFDQLALAGFLYALIRYLRSGDRRLWILLGLLAGIAAMIKMTILALGPGFLLALLISNRRRDLLTPWPWLGGALFLAIVSPYLLWQQANGWPTLEYWKAYGTIRLYPATLPQYLANLAVYMNVILLPLWPAGLFRLLVRRNGAEHRFLAVLFLATLAAAFSLRASTRFLPELFMPFLAAGAAWIEELAGRVRRGVWIRAGAAAWLLAAAVAAVLTSLPILPYERMLAVADALRPVSIPVMEFNGEAFEVSPLFPGRLGWEELVRETAEVYDGLPPEERAVAGIYAEGYMPAGAIDQLGPAYGLPHAVSGSLTYYLWGPGYSWEVMIVIASRTNTAGVFFGECELKAHLASENDALDRNSYIFVCRKPKVPAETIWSSMKLFR
jgi:4-amino-4-deoxy-L-arabinose transferase-like glycosyltransferase